MYGIIRRSKVDQRFSATHNRTQMKNETHETLKSVFMDHNLQ